MKSVALTVKRVREAYCDSGKTQTIYWDAVAGFGLRVTSNGTKAYVLETRLHGKTVRITIGSPEIWPLETQWRSDPVTEQRVEHQRGARDEARRLKSEMDRGIDPREQKKLGKARHTERLALEKLKSTTVREAWDAYVAEHRPQWGDRHIADHFNLSQRGGEPKKRGNGKTVAGPLHRLLVRRFNEINADVLADWLRTEAAARANSARKAYELFRSFWRWCSENPCYMAVVERTIVDSKKLRKQVPTRKSKRDDVLQRSHLPLWFTAVLALPNTVHRVYLQALLLTGARREEMAKLKWSDVDFAFSSIWLNSKKNKEMGDGRKVPLTPYLSELLVTLPRVNEWVFSSRNAQDGRLVEPRIAHNRALSVAGLPHVTLHGLRRSFASLAEWVEMPKGIVAQIMGHAPNATAEKHYINRPLELLAKWHVRYEAWILQQAGLMEAQSEEAHPPVKPHEFRTGLRVVK